VWAAARRQAGTDHSPSVTAAGNRCRQRAWAGAFGSQSGVDAGVGGPPRGYYGNPPVAVSARIAHVTTSRTCRRRATTPPSTAVGVVHSPFVIHRLPADPASERHRHHNGVMDVTDDSGPAEAGGGAGPVAGQRWVASWSTSLHAPTPPPEPTGVISAYDNQPDQSFVVPDPTAEGLRDQTIRMIVKPDLWGNTIRVRFSHVFGDRPLTLGAATVGLPAYAANLVVGTTVALSFGGRPASRSRPARASSAIRYRCRSSTRRRGTCSPAVISLSAPPSPAPPARSAATPRPSARRT